MRGPELSEMYYGEMRDLDVQVAVLPIGSTEPHAFHLPYSTDTLQVQEIARRACVAANEKGAKALALPATPYGCDANLLGFPFTIDLTPRVLMSLIEDVVRSLVHHGVRKIMLMNGHGGNNAALETVMRELYGRVEAFICVVHWWETAADVTNEVCETKETGHACEFETSLCLELLPDLVRMDLAEKTTTRPVRVPLVQKYGKFCRPWHLFTRNTGIGDPTKATREKGKRIADCAVSRIADMLVELSEKEWDQTFPY